MNMFGSNTACKTINYEVVFIMLFHIIIQIIVYQWITFLIRVIIYLIYISVYKTKCKTYAECSYEEYLTWKDKKF